MTGSTNPLPSITQVVFRCDTLPTDTVKMPLKGDEIQIIAAQKVGTRVFFNTLNADNLISPVYSSGYHEFSPTSHEINDTFQFYFVNGSAGGDLPVSGRIFLRVSY